MRFSKRNGTFAVGFSNQQFLSRLAAITGITPVGVLGRDTPLDFTSLETARGSLLLRELFSKYDDGTPSPEKEAETWKRFHAAETQCLESNQVIPLTFRWEPFWLRVAARVRDTLGPFSWDECAKGFSHGPGGTTRLPRKKSHGAYKYSGIPESTSGNAALASCAIRMIPLWETIVRSRGEALDSPLVKVVPGNSIITVPKSYKTDRTIAKEPCMNVYIQKGIGQCIRRRLKRVGVDLNDQSRNQRAACEGSLTGQLATVDLSMASDTVSFELVSFLLPNDWWWGLEQARSPVGTLPSGEVIRYQKFSSMGNGYTFELESLFFWAIAQEVCCRNSNERSNLVLVYGDDIVVPTENCQSLLHRLWQSGFTPNPSKTWDSGPYRESCGKHFYLGNEITPFYVRKKVKRLHQLFLVHNNLFRWSELSGCDVSEDLLGLRNLAPSSWRKPRLPDGFGDGAFIGAVDELRLDSHPHGWECWQIDVLQVTSKELEGDLPAGQLVASLKAARSDDSSKLRYISTQVFFPGRRQCEFILEEKISGLPVMEGPMQPSKCCIERYP